MRDLAERQTQFQGLRALVVEDETIIAFLVDDMLKELGFAEVVRAASVPAALSATEREIPDVAVLDVNLAGVPVFPVAEHLQAAGIPFAFASGYGHRGVPDEWAGRPVVQKPFSLDMLGDALAQCLAEPKL